MRKMGHQLSFMQVGTLALARIPPEASAFAFAPEFGRMWDLYAAAAVQAWLTIASIIRAALFILATFEKENGVIPVVYWRRRLKVFCFVKSWISPSMLWNIAPNPDNGTPTCIHSRMNRHHYRCDIHLLLGPSHRPPLHSSSLTAIPKKVEREKWNWSTEIRYICSVHATANNTLDLRSSSYEIYESQKFIHCFFSGYPKIFFVISHCLNFFYRTILFLMNQEKHSPSRYEHSKVITALTYNYRTAPKF